MCRASLQPSVDLQTSLRRIHFPRCLSSRPFSFSRCSVSCGPLIHSSKNRLRSYAAAAAAVGNPSAARSYYTKLLELADRSDGGRPELAQAKAYLQQVNR